MADDFKLIKEEIIHTTRRWEHFNKIMKELPNPMFGVPLVQFGEPLVTDSDVVDKIVSNELLLDRKTQVELYLRREEEKKKRELETRQLYEPIKKEEVPEKEEEEEEQMLKTEEIESIAMQYFLAAFKKGIITKSMYKDGMRQVVKRSKKLSWKEEDIRKHCIERISCTKEFLARYDAAAENNEASSSSVSSSDTTKRSSI
ncbi:unnamed protein product [Caenorhabditis angaria]|uniref:Uncharacterized protein n=1 Tax=Caenorhabditis angaria TaxID=860376 RepID=A0A9P1J027_9PELO|nr:unnamed protein product [Caenorhabditis angaria]